MLGQILESSGCQAGHMSPLALPLGPNSSSWLTTAFIPAPYQLLPTPYTLHSNQTVWFPECVPVSPTNEHICMLSSGWNTFHPFPSPNPSTSGLANSHSFLRPSLNWTFLSKPCLIASSH